MYAVTSICEVRRTRATFRRAEFGFFGVVVYTRVQTPRRCGEPLSAGLFVLLRGRSRPLRTSCWIVGMALSSSLSPFLHRGPKRKPDPRARLPGTCLGHSYPFGVPPESSHGYRTRPPGPG